MHNRHTYTPPTLAGLFFCLASAEGAGLLFCPVAIQQHTSVYSAFCAVHAIIPPTQQNNAQGFAGAFPVICPILMPQYQTDTSGYNAVCDTLERITAPQHIQRIPDTTATPDAVQLSTAAYYNKVYNGAAVRPLLWIRARRCSIAQTMPARHNPPSSGGGTIDGCRRISFRAFAR